MGTKRAWVLTAGLAAAAILVASYWRSPGAVDGVEPLGGAGPGGLHPGRELQRQEPLGPGRLSGGDA